MERLREEAGRLLGEILELARRRREVVRRIGLEKAKKGLPVEDPKRELELRPDLDKNLGHIFNLLLWDSLSIQGYTPMPRPEGQDGMVDLSSDEPDLFLSSGLELSGELDLEEALSFRFGMKVERAYVLPDRYLALILILWAERRGGVLFLPRPSPLVYGQLAWMAGVRPYYGFKGKIDLAGIPHNPSGTYEPEIADCTYYDFSPRPVKSKVVIYSPGAIFGFLSPSIVFGHLSDGLKALLAHFEIKAGKKVAQAFLSMKRPEWSGLSSAILNGLAEAGLKPINYNGGPFALIRKDEALKILRKVGIKVAPGKFFGLTEDHFRITLASSGIFEGLELIHEAFSRSSP